MPPLDTPPAPSPCALSLWRRATPLWIGIRALLCCSFFLPVLAMAGSLKLGGTGSALGTMKILAEAFQQSEPDFAPVILPSLGTNGGLKAVAAGAIDLAVSNRPLKEEESAQGLVARFYGRTPFVITTSKTGVSAITTSQLVAIYAGKQLAWPDGSPIRLVLRPATDGDTNLLASFSAEMKRALDVAMAKDGMVVAFTDQDSANDIQRLPGALGTSSLALLRAEQRPLVPLALNGVTPSVETLANGTYPYAKSAYLVSKGTLTGQMARFIEFIFSPAGQAILYDTGHWVSDLQRSTP